MRAIAAVTLLLLLGCAHAEVTPPTVAVLAVETMGVPPEQGEAFHAALVQEMEKGKTALPAPAQKVDAALQAETAVEQGCRESDACLARAGRRVPSDTVLSLTVGGLGNLWLVRGRLVRAQDGLPLQEVQETAEGGSHAVVQYAPQLAHRLFPDTSKQPWYKQWWLWTAVGVGLGAGAVTIWAVTKPKANEGAVVIGSL
jgi:hypothetical protein